MCLFQLSELSVAWKTKNSPVPNNDTAVEYPETETVLLRVYTAADPIRLRTIDVKSLDDRIESTCPPGLRDHYKLIVHGFAETWNMSFRWNWVDDMRNEMLANSAERDRVCFIAVDWEGLARGGVYMANYWRAIDNMEIAGRIMAEYFKANQINEKNVHCIGFSLGAHMCSIFYKVYFRKFGVKLDRITGLDPAGPFFKVNIINVYQSGR